MNNGKKYKKFLNLFKNSIVGHFTILSGLAKKSIRFDRIQVKYFHLYLNNHNSALFIQ